MRNISLIFKQFSKTVLLIAGFVILGLSAHAQADLSKGEALFKANCTTCHKVESQLVGPALGPMVTGDSDDKWLTKWIENNQALIAAKDPKAVTIYNKFNQQGMTVFGNLADADVANILAYIRDDWKKKQAVVPSGGPTTAVDSGPGDFVIWSLVGVIIIAFIVILVLNKVIATLERLLLKGKGLLIEEDTAAEEAKAKVSADRMAVIKHLAKNKKFIFFVMLCGTVACGSWGWVTLWNTNVHQGYQPVQPIHFPHDLHAGVMKIDCQYCHSGAYKSKNASIPSLNICMNCHKVIDRKLGDKEPSAEIAKIYDALGYDTKTQKYDSTKSHPMQWVRVHNLPDFAYFNHSQHVKVGKIKCQTCHGPVQTMSEIYQYSPLTMKWCIQCHKRTEVDFSGGAKKGNAYYDNMLAVHDRIRRGEKVTEASMGGIECGKCHY